MQFADHKGLTLVELRLVASKLSDGSLVKQAILQLIAEQERHLRHQTAMPLTRRAPRA